MIGTIQFQKPLGACGCLELGFLLSLGGQKETAFLQEACPPVSGLPGMVSLLTDKCDTLLVYGTNKKVLTLAHTCRSSLKPLLATEAYQLFLSRPHGEQSSQLAY